MSDAEDEPTHENTIEAALLAALNPATADLAQSNTDVGLAPLRDYDDAEVTVRSARNYRDAMVLTWDRGIEVDLSDGSQFRITIVRSANPRR
jgi:hypothetical protein